jgi:hypothetical protein
MIDRSRLPVKPLDRALFALNRLASENPAAFSALVEFIEDPPEHGKIELGIRHRKLNGCSVTRATYGG